MGKAIGPNFPNELKAAGLDPIPPLTYEAATGAIFMPTLTQAQKDIVNAVYVAHDPTVIPAATVRDQAIDAAIAGDATIANLKAMSPAQYDAWWTANVTNAAQAITILKLVTRVVIRKLL